MPRTEPDKNLTELLGMIRRDFTPRPPQLLLVQEQENPKCDDCNGTGNAFGVEMTECFGRCPWVRCASCAGTGVKPEPVRDSDVTDYRLEEIICADERDDDIESREELPGH